MQIKTKWHVIKYTLKDNLHLKTIFQNVSMGFTSQSAPALMPKPIIFGKIESQIYITYSCVMSILYLSDKKMFGNKVINIFPFPSKCLNFRYKWFCVF